MSEIERKVIRDLQYEVERQRNEIADLRLSWQSLVRRVDELENAIRTATPLRTEDK